MITSLTLSKLKKYLFSEQLLKFSLLAIIIVVSGCEGNRHNAYNELEFSINTYQVLIGQKNILLADKNINPYNHKPTSIVWEENTLKATKEIENKLKSDIAIINELNTYIFSYGVDIYGLYVMPENRKQDLERITITEERINRLLQDAMQDKLISIYKN